jgi:histone H3/H4
MPQWQSTRFAQQYIKQMLDAQHNPSKPSKQAIHTVSLSQHTIMARSKVSNGVKMDYEMFFKKQYNLAEVVSKVKYYDRSERIALVDIILKEPSMSTISSSLAENVEHIPDNFQESGCAKTLISLVHKTEEVTQHSVLFVCFFPMGDEDNANKPAKKKSGRKPNPLPNHKAVFKALHNYYGSMFPNLPPLPVNEVVKEVHKPAVVDDNIVEKVQKIVKAELSEVVERLTLAVGLLREDVCAVRKRDFDAFCEHVSNALKQERSDPYDFQYVDQGVCVPPKKKSRKGVVPS